MGRKKEDLVGSVLVVGGGIGGTQAALDLAESGFKVYLTEKTTSIGGVMAQLDKTFPTNDCSMCILAPKLVAAGRHPNIDLIINTDITGIKGTAGNYTVTVLKRSLFVDQEKCTGCGVCGVECPIEAIDMFNEGLARYKATAVKYAQAVPLVFAINQEKCVGCGVCAGVCKANAIVYDQEDEVVVLNVGSVILSPGFDEFDPEPLRAYGYGKYDNVVTSIEFERILSASGPYSGMVLRPSDGEIPEKVAFLQCIGSRDCHHAQPYCSSVCCMYTAKEAVIAKEHQKEVNPTIFSMDVRAYGKDFDKYIVKAQEHYGVRYIRSRVSFIEENPTTNDLYLTFETEKGEIKTEVFNLVVLSVGLNPPEDAKKLADTLGIELNENDFCQTQPFAPTETTKPGIFVCGAFSEPKDIPDTVVEASAAVGRVNILLSSVRNTMVEKREFPAEKDVSGVEPRVGAFICHCGINIGSVVNVPEVVKHIKTLPYVVYAGENLYTCSADTQTKIRDIIEEYDLNRIVVASCTPRTHESLFRETVREAGINPYLFQMANIRDQCSWVHMHQPEDATAKAKDLAEMAVNRAVKNEILQQHEVAVIPQALVIGGGISGMSAALNLAKQGHHVYLVEKNDELGGFARNLYTTIEGYDIQQFLKNMIADVESNSNITIFTKTVAKDIQGYLGNFSTQLINTENLEVETIEHGAIIVAVGAKEFSPEGHYYREHPLVVTQSTLEYMLNGTDEIYEKKSVVMIQCVGSRNEEHPYCSKVCCTEAIKNALKIKESSPKTEVIILYRDIRTYGFKEKYYRESREKGVMFIRYNESNPPEIEKDGKTLNVVVTMLDSNKLKIASDLVVLSAGMVPQSNVKELSQMLKVPLNAENFFLEAHVKLRPVDFATEGIYLAGTARAPVTIRDSISQGNAVAARAMTVLSKETILAGGVTSYVDESACTGCRICIRLCPYNAITRNDFGTAQVNEALCKGCGVCAASCPEKAMIIRHFKTEQILAEILAFGGAEIEL